MYLPFYIPSLVKVFHKVSYSLFACYYMVTNLLSLVEKLLHHCKFAIPKLHARLAKFITLF